MSDGVCTQFVLHAWKTDVCANCLRPRLKHEASAFSQSEHHCSTSSPSKHVNSDLAESTHATNVCAAKPSPVKAKPVISSKPEKPKKPCLVGEQDSVKSDIKQCDERTSTEHVTPSKMKNADPNNPLHFQFTEEESLSFSVGASEATHTTDMRSESEKDMHSNDKTFHHYEVYDVTARGLSGAQRELKGNATASEDNIVDQSLESESRKFQTLPVTAKREIEVAEEHVAMPYNVVDVTILRPRTSNIFHSSDAASGGNSAVATTSTWPNKPQPAKRQMIPKTSPKPRERVTKTLSSSNVEVSSHQEPGGCAEASAVASKIMQSDLVSERYAHRIYEDIDDLDVDQSSYKTAAHSLGNKSPAFEAKLAALASLDFGKTNKPVTPVASAVNPTEETAPAVTNTSSVQDTVVVPAMKQEKIRKSGRKTFFQKFLKFGSKDTSEAGQSSAISSSDEASSKVAQCSSSPSPGRINVSDDAKSSVDALPPQPVALSEKQAMLMNLKDCLAKRQTSIGSDSSEVSSIHSRTRSSESTPLRSSIQSVSSVQQVHGINAEKNEQHTVTLPETLPPADSLSGSSPIHKQPSSTDVSFSPPPHSCTVLSEMEKSPRNVDKKDNEVQRLVVKDLTVVTEDVGTVDCSVSTCSSDAISPTPSDLSVEASDHHSLKRRSRTDRQVRSRRMMEAPPPPPAGAPTAVLTQNANSSNVPTCPKLVTESVEVESKRPACVVRHVSVPCDSSASSVDVPLSHSLPRLTSKTALLVDKTLPSDDAESITCKAELAVKHACSKTLSEDAKLDTEHSNEGSGADNRTDEERLSDLSERRTSKFINRALPDPPSTPSSVNSNSAQKAACPEELHNLYELISQSVREDTEASAGEVLNTGEMYEDIDNCLERSDAGPASGPRDDSLSSHKSSTSRGSSIQYATQDDEYLEPVIPPEEELRQSSNWRPSPAPRSSLSAAAEVHQTSYVNAEMMSTELPSLADGITTVMKICHDALKQIAERMTAQYLSASWPSSHHLEWSDFEISDDSQSQLIQQHVSYYCAKHPTLAPKGCVLMVFKTWPQRPLTTHQHPNIVSPLATFSAPHLSTGTCTSIDNVAVLPSSSVLDFRQYWQELHSCSESEHIEYSACLTLARLISAALYLYECSSETPRLLPRRILMTVLDTGECYPLLRPSTRLCNSSDTAGTIADEVAELISVMLQFDSSAKTDGGDMRRRKSDTSLRREKPVGVDVAAAISPQSSYSRCLQRVVRCLHQKNGNLWNGGLSESLRLLEFTLWGPSEDEARMIAVSDRRDTALQVWLSVTRCRLLAELAVLEGISQNGLEVAERAAFLSSATENSLLAVTKLLFT